MDEKYFILAPVLSNNSWGSHTLSLWSTVVHVQGIELAPPLFQASVITDTPARFVNEPYAF